MIRVGVVGQGFIARAHSLALQQLRRLERVELAPSVLCGRDAKRAEENGRLWGYERATTDWRELVGADDVDLVCVCSPNDTHHAIVLAALAAGKHVLCEKPLGRTRDESAEMVAAARTAEGLHACSFNYRFMPAVALARELIAAGEIGTPTAFRARYLQDWGLSRLSSWHYEREHAGAGVIGDYAHIVDLAHHLIGDVERVSAETRTVGGRTTEDAYVGAGRFRSGALLALESSRVAAGRKAQQAFEIDGEEGSLRWDMEELNQLWLYRRGDGPNAGFRRILVTEPEHPFLEHWWPSGHVLGWEHALVHQWHALAHGAARPLASFEDGWRADVVVDALVGAARAGRAVEVDYGG